MIIIGKKEGTTGYGPLRKKMKYKKRTFHFSRAVIIDDEALAAYITLKILESTNLSQTISVFTDADLALTSIQNAIELDQLPDIFFVDFNMDGINGLQFITRLLRTCDINNMQAPHIVVLSSHISFQDRLNLDMLSDKITILAKPLSLKNVEEIINLYF